MPRSDAETPSTPDRPAATHRRVDRSLIAYALAGGAVVAAATTANAAIVTSGSVGLICPSAGSPLGNAGNGGNGGVGGVQFAMGGNGGNGGDGFAATASGRFGWEHDTENNHSVVMVTASPGSVLEFARVASDFGHRFAYGEEVGAGGNGGSGGLFYSGSPAYLAAYDDSNSHVAGLGHQWMPGASGYLGFRFLNVSGDYRYGWVEFMVPWTAAAGEPVTLVQWAYQDDPNGEIYAGVIPAPGTAAVAALAAGALGLSGRRRDRRRS
jgi:hypothetical protein